MNKKGFIGDAAFVIVVLFVLGLVAVVGFQVFGELNDSIQAKEGFSNESKALLQTNYDAYAPLWDGIVAFGMALLGIALILSTAAIGTRPEFFFLTILVGMLLIGGVAMLSNVWAEATTTGPLAGAASSFTFTNLLFDNYALIALLFVALLTIGLFVKARGLV